MVQIKPRVFRKDTCISNSGQSVCSCLCMKAYFFVDCYSMNKYASYRLDGCNVLYIQSLTYLRLHKNGVVRVKDRRW